MTFPIQATQRLTDLQKRVDRLETLEAAAGGVGGFTLIETIRKTGDATEFLFEDIPQTYQHLFWDYSLRGHWVGGSGSGSFVNVYLQMNGDTGNNYAYRINWGGFTQANVNISVIPIGLLYVPGSGIPTYDETYANEVGWINHYQSAVKKTSITFHGGTMVGTSGEVPRSISTWKGSGVWDSLSPITELRFSSVVGVASIFFLVGSRISLYGVGQASS